MSKYYVVCSKVDEVFNTRLLLITTVEAKDIFEAHKIGKELCSDKGWKFEKVEAVVDVPCTWLSDMSQRAPIIN